MSKFPPRVWLTLWPADGWSHGAQYTHAYRIRKFEEDLEYLSTQEHEHLLEAAQAEAAALRAEVERLGEALERVRTKVCASDTELAVNGTPTISWERVWLGDAKALLEEALASTERGGEESR